MPKAPAGYSFGQIAETSSVFFGGRGPKTECLFLPHANLVGVCDDELTDFNELTHDESPLEFFAFWLCWNCSLLGFWGSWLSTDDCVQPGNCRPRGCARIYIYIYKIYIYIYMYAYIYTAQDSICCLIYIFVYYACLHRHTSGFAQICLNNTQHVNEYEHAHR